MKFFRRRPKLSKVEQQRQEVGPNGWTCHVCGDYRPDAMISVRSSVEELAPNLPIQQNVRYCNDRQACIDGAKNVNWIKND